MVQLPVEVTPRDMIKHSTKTFAYQSMMMMIMIKMIVMVIMVVVMVVMMMMMMMLTTTTTMFSFYLVLFQNEIILKITFTFTLHVRLLDTISSCTYIAQFPLFCGVFLAKLPNSYDARQIHSQNFLLYQFEHSIPTQCPGWSCWTVSS